MVIYDQEKEDGISIAMLCKGSISYASCIEPVNAESIGTKGTKSIAAYSDKDLYYVQSILVSSNWNKNDDIFDKAEVWAAKNTPEDKPTNLEHDENTIIGHIVSNWPVTESGEVLPEDTKSSDLPDKFHIMTASVVYKAFTDPDLKARSEQLIKEIEDGTKYVSMECFFSDFDYGLINQTTGEYKVLNRNYDTAYLTKYLRSYGGRGEFENHKIGRVLRNITFSGKGFVDKPANADSIIFTKNNIDTEKNEENKKIGVFDNQTDSHYTENDIMAENATATEQPSELETVNKELTEKVEALEKQIQETVSATESATQEHEAAQAEVAKTCEEMKVKLEADHAGATTELEASHEEKLKEATEKLVAEHCADMKNKEDELSAMYEKKLAEQEELLATYRKNEEERMMAEMYKKRMGSLVEAGLSEEDADITTKQFESLSDEQFESIVATLSKVSTQNLESAEEPIAETAESSESGTEETTEEATDSEEGTSEASEILDEVEVEEEVTLAVGGEEESEAEHTRAALVDFVYSRLGKK
jgi:hypothetical protein